MWITSTEIQIPRNFSDIEVSKEWELYYESLPKTLKFNEFLKIFVRYYVEKINSIILSNISQNPNDLYDEVLIFQFSSDSISLTNYPIFTLNSRDDEEWYEYLKDAERILSSFKATFHWKKIKDIFNVPILLENAPWTEFDIMIVIDSWYIVFLNKKKSEVSMDELEQYQNIVQDMIYWIRKKINNLV